MSDPAPTPSKPGPRSTREKAAGMLMCVSLGAIGGTIAHLLHTPMPWMIGSLLINAAWVLLFPSRINQPVFYPDWFRRSFITVIAVMIGGTFTPALVGSVVQWWPSMLGMLAFALMSQAIVYTVFRRFAHLDKPTAFFAASPGGLIESMALGEQAGGDERLIALLHFVRLTLIVILVPVGFTIWTGHSVGSAAGQSFAAPGATLTALDIVMLIASGVVGFYVGRWLRIPAAVVVGPLLLSGVLHVTGATEGQVPMWVGSIAQVFMGSGIGARFAGLRRNVVLRAMGLCLCTVSVMMTLAIGFSILLSPMVDVPPAVITLAFAPAGLVEMSLIALTLGANPVFVTLHHVVRLLVCVIVLPQIYYRLINRSAGQQADEPSDKQVGGP